MKKKIQRRLNLSRETLQRLDQPELRTAAAGGGTAGTACCTGITQNRPTFEQTCGDGGATGPKQL
jgi:hypothetical protein